MLLGRREKPDLLERVRVALWPRRSWARSLRYFVLRLERLDATPHALGLGLAIGIFMAFQPILGFQMFAAGAAAWAFRASVAAALIATFVSCPLTWPFMWFASYELGALIIGEELNVTSAELWSTLSGLVAAARAGSREGIAAGGLFWHILKPLAVGAIPLGLISGTAVYAMVLKAAGKGYRRRLAVRGR